MTDYFFSLPGFVRGAGRTLDLGGGLHKGSYFISDSPADADARAVASDWATVDHDLTVAANRLVDEQEEEPK